MQFYAVSVSEIMNAQQSTSTKSKKLMMRGVAECNFVNGIENSLHVFCFFVLNFYSQLNTIKVM